MDNDVFMSAKLSGFTNKQLQSKTVPTRTDQQTYTILLR